MTAEEKVLVLHEVTVTAELFDAVLSETKALLYLEAIEDLPRDALIWALQESRRRLKFFPKPAELRELISGSPDDAATLAWTRFLRAVEDVGTYTSVDFSDQALHATIEALGGWHQAWQIERLSLHDLGFKRHEFCRTYMAFKNLVPGDAPKIMLGQHAITNKSARSSWTHGLEHGEAYIAIGPDGHPAETKQLVSSDQRAIPDVKGSDLEDRLALPSFSADTTSAPEISEADQEAHRQLVKSQARAIRARTEETVDKPEEHWTQQLTNALEETRP